MRSGSSTILQIGWSITAGGILILNAVTQNSESPAPCSLMSTGIMPSQAVWSQPPEPKLRLPPIITNPPPRLVTSSTVHSSCSGRERPA